MSGKHFITAYLLDRWRGEGTGRVIFDAVFWSKVGGRRGTIAGPFSTSPFRTVLAPFSAHGSPISRRSLSRLYASRGPSQVLTILSVPLPRVSGIAPII